MADDTNWQQLVRAYLKEQRLARAVSDQYISARAREHIYRQVIENLMLFPGDRGAVAQARDILEQYADAGQRDKERADRIIAGENADG